MKPSKNSPNASARRIINFFKRFSSKKDKMRLNQDLPQRDFDRFPVEFEVRVTLIDNNGEEVQDRAELHDISGSGALFITRIPEKYYIGQIVQLKIFLAGTDDVRACIKSESSVVRMQKLDMKDANDDSIDTGIAVKFQKTFEFERVDKTVFSELK